MGWLFCSIGFLWLVLFLSSANAVVALDYEKGSLPAGEIDLDTLRYELLAVVNETMRPAPVSRWLRQGATR